MHFDFKGIYEAIDISQIPDIQLYMDQITTFMDDKLEKYKRSPEDKIITKTMINNYTKDKILPPPEKKKYAPEQLMLLIIVFHLKHVLSITDIGKLINSASAQAIKKSDLYLLFTQLQQYESDFLTKNIDSMEAEIEHLISELHLNEEDEMLNMLLLAFAVSIDAAAKKHVAEYIIDTYIT